MEERFYEEYAAIQDEHWWFEGRRRIIGALLEQRLDPSRRNERRVLDIGCGTGTNLAELARFGEVQGVDQELAAIEVCRKRGWPVRHVSGSSLPFEDASFDLITLLDVIEHVDDDQTLLTEARRVLAPGGLVLVTVPAYRWMWGSQDEIAHHRRRYTRRRLVVSLTRAGLEPLASSYFNTLLFPPIAGVRLMRRLGPQPEELRSDFELNRPGVTNAVLTRTFCLEAQLLKRTSMPFGVSILGFAASRG